MTDPIIADTILPGKLTAPDLGRFFERPDLLRRIGEFAASPRRVWISSPGGAGKTSLVRAFLTSDPRPFVWYHVDHEDHDPANLFLYLSSTVPDGDAEEKPLPPFTSEYLPNLAVFCRNFFRAYFARLPLGCILVLDDFQEGPGEPFFGPVLTAAMAELPDNSTLFVLSREEPYPSLARGRLNGSLACLDWDDLRLSSEEIRDYIAWAQETELSPDDMDSIYELTHGWFAGLLLFLKNPANIQLRKKFSFEYTDLLFDYFAGEAFARFPTDIRQFLLTCGLFPTTIKVNIAVSLSGRQDAGEILRGLVRANHFTFRVSTNPDVYRFHPLFRQFLQNQAVRELSTQQLAEMQQQAAQLLHADGEFDAAAALLITARSWPSLIEVIRGQANTLLQQGRSHTLLHWLDALPEEQRRADQWLCYWRGCCLLAIEPEPAKEEFITSFDLFTQSDNAVGCMLAWSMVINAINIGWNNYGELDTWIAYFDQLRERYPQYPSLEIEAKVLQAICMSLVWRQPDRSDLPDLIARLRQLVMASSDSTFRLLAGTTMVFHYVVAGNLAAACSTVELLNGDLSSRETSPLKKLQWLSVRAIVEWILLDREACLRTMAESRAIIEGSGVHVFDLRVFVQGITLGLTTNDIELAGKLLADISTTPITTALDRSLWCYMQADFNLLTGDVAKAVALAEIAVSAAKQGGSVVAMSFSFAEQAMALLQDGQIEQAKNAVEQGLVCSRGMNYFTSLFYLLAAHIALEQADTKRALDRLREGLGIAARQGYLNFHPWRDAIMARLCREAIEAGIEVEYAGRLATYRKLDISRPGSPRLTPKEIEILAWVREGKSNWEIAQIQRVSERTVKFHLCNVMKKLGVNSRTRAVSIAMEYGILAGNLSISTGDRP